MAHDGMCYCFGVCPPDLPEDLLNEGQKLLAVPHPLTDTSLTLPSPHTRNLADLQYLAAFSIHHSYTSVPIIQRTNYESVRTLGPYDLSIRRTRLLDILLTTSHLPSRATSTT